MSVLTIKKDDIVTHGAVPHRIIDILMSGSLLSNIEMEKAGYENARTFNFPGDITYDQKKSTVEAHNVCLDLNKFYGFASKERAYIVIPAHALAERGYQFMEQDGFHVLPPGYTGPNDADGTNISLQDIPFRIVADKETAEMLAKAMRASGLYDQQKIDETFIVSDKVSRLNYPTDDYEEERVAWLESKSDAPPPVARYESDIVFDEAKNSMGLGMKNAPDIELTRPENRPSVLTRAFPNGDSSHIYRSANGYTDYTPTPPVTNNKWNLEVIERNDYGLPRVLSISDKYNLVHTPTAHDRYNFDVTDKNGEKQMSLRFYDPERGSMGSPGWSSNRERWKIETCGKNLLEEPADYFILYSRAARRGILGAFMPPPPPSQRLNGSFTDGAQYPARILPPDDDADAAPSSKPAANTPSPSPGA